MSVVMLLRQVVVHRRRHRYTAVGFSGRELARRIFRWKAQQ
jgi:hypothetical protein